MKCSFASLLLNRRNSHAECFRFITACCGRFGCTIVVTQKVRNVVILCKLWKITQRFFRPFGSLEFESYWSLDEIYDFMDELETTYPGFAEVEHMGITEGGRQIRGLRLTNEEHLGQESLHVIFVTAGKVARDWITVMSAVNLMHELLDHYEDNRAVVGNIKHKIWSFRPKLKLLNLQTTSSGSLFQSLILMDTNSRELKA